jgi:hypothetical protein
MFILLMLFAVMSGTDDPRMPANDPGAKRTLLPERVVGRYHQSPGLESSRTITITKAGESCIYSYEMTTDDGGFIEAEGPVQFVDDRVNLIVKKMEQNRDFTVDGKRVAEIRVMPFFLIKWDKTTYLVEEEKLDKFCNEVNLREESKPNFSGDFFYRDEVKDDNGAASTIHDVPTHAKKFILGKPISGKILSIEGGRAKVDLGEQEQVWKNMVLYCEPDEPGKNEILKKGGKKGEEKLEGRRAMLKVVEVHKHHCVAVICEHPNKINLNKLGTGYKVYSRFPDLASMRGMYKYRW